MYKNKNVLITGASSGLGKILAINYAKQGAKIINLSRNIQKIDSLNHKLNKLNNTENIGFNIDVSKYEQVKSVKNNLLKDKCLPDIIINNAAGNFLCPFEKLTVNGWKRINDIVLNGAFNIYHNFGKTFIEQKKQAVFLNISTTLFLPITFALCSPTVRI